MLAHCLVSPTLSCSVVTRKRSSNRIGPFERQSGESNMLRKRGPKHLSALRRRRIQMSAPPRSNFEGAWQPKYESFRPDPVQPARSRLSITAHQIWIAYTPSLCQVRRLRTSTQQRPPPVCSTCSSTIYNHSRKSIRPFPENRSRG